MKIRLSDEDRALLWLNITLGSSTARVRKMLEAFDGSATEAFRAAAKTKYRNSNFLMMNAARICITTRHKDT